MRLNYCDVVAQLLQILVAIYNKMDDISLDPGVLNALKSIDQHICSEVLKPVCQDLNKVATKKATTSLYQLCHTNKLNQ